MPLSEIRPAQVTNTDLPDVNLALNSFRGMPVPRRSVLSKVRKPLSQSARLEVMDADVTCLTVIAPPGYKVAARWAIDRIGREVDSRVKAFL